MFLPWLGRCNVAVVEIGPLRRRIGVLRLADDRNRLEVLDDLGQDGDVVGGGNLPARAQHGR